MGEGRRSPLACLTSSLSGRASSRHARSACPPPPAPSLPLPRLTAGCELRLPAGCVLATPPHPRQCDSWRGLVRERAREKARCGPRTKGPPPVAHCHPPYVPHAPPPTPCHGCPPSINPYSLDSGLDEGRAGPRRPGGVCERARGKRRKREAVGEGEEGKDGEGEKEMWSSFGRASSRPARSAPLSLSSLYPLYPVYLSHSLPHALTLYLTRSHSLSLALTHTLSLSCSYTPPVPCLISGYFWIYIMWNSSLFYTHILAKLESEGGTNPASGQSESNSNLLDAVLVRKDLLPSRTVSLPPSRALSRGIQGT